MHSSVEVRANMPGADAEARTRGHVHAMSDNGSGGSAGWSTVVVAGSVAATLPGAILGAAAFLGRGLPGWSPVLLVAVFGAGVVGAAMLLSWATEVVQLDVAAGLALALLALIAVLPEYAVDAVFAIEAGNAVEQYGVQCQSPDASGDSPCSLALANMTGANRLLVGIGWPLIVGVALLSRRRRGPGEREEEPGAGIGLPRSGATEVGFLAVASIYGMTLPLRSRITLVDGAILVALFAAYVARISRAPVEEPQLFGPSAWIGERPERRRRLIVAAMFVWAAATVLLVAEHFADALVGAGRQLGVSEFFLVQWVAPLASESPELVVASLYAWRLATTDSLGTLVASKVNQWTLLVGTLPLLFALAIWDTTGLPVDAQQRRELLLTAAQALFAVTLIIDLRLHVRNAAALFVLFVAQFVLDAVVPFADITVYALSGIYLAGAVVVILRRRRAIPRLLRDAFRTSYDEMQAHPVSSTAPE
jgi:cation:H+ antiporter